MCVQARSTGVTLFCYIDSSCQTILTDERLKRLRGSLSFVDEHIVYLKFHVLKAVVRVTFLKSHAFLRLKQYGLQFHNVRLPACKTHVS